MKNRPFPHVLVVLLLGAALAQCQQLTIQTEGGKQTVVARSDIESLAHVKVATHGSENNATFEGVALKTVLETDKQIVLAFLQDGKPLDTKAGPYRIVIPDEKRMARWVRQVTTLKIVDVQKEVNPSESLPLWL